MVTSPVHLLSIESSPPFVNRVQSTFCQLSPVHLLSIESSPPFVNRVQSTFCQSSPVHLLLIESSPPFVSPVQSTFCHMPCKNTKHACLCRDKIFEVNVKIGCVPKIIVDLLDILWCVFLQILAKLVILIIDPVILIYIIVE